MRSLLGAAVLGGIGTFLAFSGVRSVLSTRTIHIKENYRGKSLIATAGLVLLFPVALGVASALSFAEPDRNDALVLGGTAFVMAVLGLVDDLYGSRRAGGLLGHARELLHGRVTTGLVKAVGGAVAGIVAAFALGHRGVWIVIGGAVIAMAANMANLLDLRPARAAKVFVPLAITVCVTGGASSVNRIVASVVGGVVVFAYWELREVVMLGDVGANLLGSVLGVAAVSAWSRSSIAIAAGVLLALTLIAERVSFSSVIEAISPLRWLDQLGRVGGDT